MELNSKLLCLYRDSGSVNVEKTVPDTITKWAAGAFCVSSAGFGVSPNTGLTAFQPFFVSLTLPYSVIRGEVFTLKATVFNYLSKCIMVLFSSGFRFKVFENKNLMLVFSFWESFHLCLCLQVKVTLADSDQYTFRDCEGCQYSVCLCGDESRTFSWIVTPTVLGINREMTRNNEIIKKRLNIFDWTGDSCKFFTGYATAGRPPKHDLNHHLETWNIELNIFYFYLYYFIT